MGNLLPEIVDGWRPSGPDREFDKDTLYDLIDGGAEVYRSLNVKKVLSRVYSKEGGADIFVDLFDMGSSKDAYGAYHHDVREKADAGVGQESEYQGGSLYFWKNRYFLSIVALAENPQTTSAVMTIGNQVSASIGKDGKKPKLLAFLPKRGLEKQHLYFFHDAETLDRRYFVGEGNPLNLSSRTDGFLAKYRIDGNGQSEESAAVFMAVAYKSKSDSLKARNSLYKNLFSTLPALEVVERAENKWAGAKAAGKRLFAVLEASDREMAKSLLDQAGRSGRG